MRRWLRHLKFRQFFIRPLTVALIFSLAGSTLLYFSIAQDSNPYIAPNPPIVSQSCLGGLNIALLADTSGSIENDEFIEMQDAFKDFISSLLPSTRITFSVSQFAGDAKVVQPFTSSVSILYGAIDRLDRGNVGGTNWTDGLQAAYSTFSGGQPDKPNLLIIATDGNPTQPRDSAVSSAINSANYIKAVNIRILALGIGRDLQVENLMAISGPIVNRGGVNSDVITTDFSTLGASLQSIGQSTCSSGTGSGGDGAGTGGTGTGSGGTGTGTGGSGVGSGGTGVGTGGTGTGSNGGGTGSTGSGTGTSTGTKPQPSPTPVPSAPLGTPPSPAPIETESPQPTPAPIAMPTPEPQPDPAPTPTAQGVQSKPPDPPPSPFYDGKEYAPGSASDNFDPTVTARRPYWLYGVIATAVIAAAAGYVIWTKKYGQGAKSSTAAGKSRK